MLARPPYQGSETEARGWGWGEVSEGREENAASGHHRARRDKTVHVRTVQDKEGGKERKEKKDSQQEARRGKKEINSVTQRGEGWGNKIKSHASRQLVELSCASCLSLFSFLSSLSLLSRRSGWRWCVLPVASPCTCPLFLHAACLRKCMASTGIQRRGVEGRGGHVLYCVWRSH